MWLISVFVCDRKYCCVADVQQYLNLLYLNTAAVQEPKNTESHTMYVHPGQKMPNKSLHKTKTISTRSMQM